MSTPSDPCWIVAVTIADRLALGGTEPMLRDDFLPLLWELLDGTGLAGIHEGSLDVSEAFASGITPGALIVDTAAADPSRDWVSARATITAELWFHGEPGARTAAGILTGITGCAVLGVRHEPPHDWEAESRAAHGPIDIPGFGTIVPPWHPAPRVGTTLVIDPGSGFGTGLHPTTQLCLAALAAGGSPPRRILDFGAGSGILGIAAALRGARTVDSIEVDPLVHAAIRHNATLNGVAERVAVAPDLPPADPGSRYDLVFANIVAPVLLDHVAALTGLLAPGGRLVLSGLRAADLPGVVTSYRRLLRAEPITTELDGWHCLVFAAE